MLTLAFDTTTFQLSQNRHCALQLRLQSQGSPPEYTGASKALEWSRRVPKSFSNAEDPPETTSIRTTVDWQNADWRLHLVAQRNETRVYVVDRGAFKVVACVDFAVSTSVRAAPAHQNLTGGCLRYRARYGT
jgi:hypothetical protein